MQMVQNVVLFQGVNTSNEPGLWETNGTTSGTFELAPIVGANASGLSPSNITGYNGEVLFEGRDFERLWIVGDDRHGRRHV